MSYTRLNHHDDLFHPSDNDLTADSCFPGLEYAVVKLEDVYPAPDNLNTNDYDPLEPIFPNLPVRENNLKEPSESSDTETLDAEPVEQTTLPIPEVKETKKRKTAEHSVKEEFETRSAGTQPERAESLCSSPSNITIKNISEQSTWIIKPVASRSHHDTLENQFVFKFSKNEPSLEMDAARVSLQANSFFNSKKSHSNESLVYSSAKSRSVKRPPQHSYMGVLTIPMASISQPSKQRTKNRKKNRA